MICLFIARAFRRKLTLEVWAFRRRVSLPLSLDFQRTESGSDGGTHRRHLGL